jgi:hypothetical protein
MSVKVKIWGPPHVEEEIIIQLNIWIENHPDHPIREDLLQDHISSHWPLLWHLQVCVPIDIEKRKAVLTNQTLRGNDTDVCAICLNELRGGSEILDCLHRFHTMCIHRWVRTSSTCPICRSVC